jgi:hypothetical protein
VNNAFWFLTWPLALLASTVDAWAQMLRQWQDVTARNIDFVMPAAAGLQQPVWPGMPSASATPARKEPDAMTNRDIDLSGEDRLKLVRYKIVFLKRDYETAFPEQEELVTYDTSPGDWAGIKVAHFMGDLQTWSEEDRNRLAPRWRKKNYPPRDRSTNRFCIPGDDERYIKVYFEVLQRWDRIEADYEKRRTEAIEDIRDFVAGPHPSEC